MILFLCIEPPLLDCKSVACYAAYPVFAAQVTQHLHGSEWKGKAEIHPCLSNMLRLGREIASYFPCTCVGFLLAQSETALCISKLELNYFQV